MESIQPSDPIGGGRLLWVICSTLAARLSPRLHLTSLASHFLLYSALTCINCLLNDSCSTNRGRAVAGGPTRSFCRLRSPRVIGRSAV